MATDQAATLQDKTKALVRTVLGRHQIDRDLSPGESLTDAGLSSLDMVNLMLAVEAEFDIFIPPAFVNAGNFRSIATIAHMVGAVRGGAAS